MTAENATPKNASAASAAATGAYHDGTWVTDGPVRVCFDNIGEGHNGDYDETDPDDQPLYRLDCQVRADSTYTQRGGCEETDDPEWVYPQDGSLCTAVVVGETPAPRLRALLAEAAAELRTAVEGNGSIKRTMDRLSWMS